METEVGYLNGWKTVNKGANTTKYIQRRGQGSGNIELYRTRSEFRFKSQCKRPLRDFKEKWYNLISVCKYHHCYENNAFQRYKIERKMIEEKEVTELFQYLRQEIMWVELEQHQWRGKEVYRFKTYPQLGSHPTEFKKYITFLTQHKKCLPEKFTLKGMVFSH